MEGLKLDHPLFHRLRTEHRHIEQLLELLNNPLPRQQDLQLLFEANEVQHHPKEESILFKKIMLHPRLGEGGPMCTLYFDQHLMSDPLSLSQSLTGQDVELLPEQEIFYKTSSPLHIPLAEHRAGRSILSYAIEHFYELPKEQLLVMLDHYQKLQLAHINKEETCFFHLCVSLLTPAEADQLLTAWDD